MKLVLVTLAATLAACGALKKSAGAKADSADSTLTCTLSASPTTVTAGQSATLTLHVSGGGTATLNGVAGIADGGTATVTPAQSSVYAATAVNGSATAVCTVTVTVSGSAADAPGCALSASPAEVAAGQAVAITMATSGTVTGATLNGAAVSNAGGSTTINPTRTTAVSGSVTGAGNMSSMCAVIVTVGAPSPSPPSPPSPTPQGSNACVTETATLDNQVTTAATADTQAYEAALAAHGLSDYAPAATHTIATFGSAASDYCQIDPHWPPTQTCPATTPAVSGSSFNTGTEYTFQGSSGTIAFIAGPQGSGCGSPTPLVLAQDNKSHVYAISQHLQASSTQNLLFCGCHYTCGGAEPPPQQTIYQLPAAGSYQGNMAINYSGPIVTSDYDNLDPTTHQECPQPALR